MKNVCFMLLVQDARLTVREVGNRSWSIFQIMKTLMVLIS